MRQINVFPIIFFGVPIFFAYALLQGVIWGNVNQYISCNKRTDTCTIFSAKFLEARFSPEKKELIPNEIFSPSKIEDYSCEFRPDSEHSKYALYLTGENIYIETFRKYPDCTHTGKDILYSIKNLPSDRTVTIFQYD